MRWKWGPKPPFPYRLANGRTPLEKKLHPMAQRDKQTNKQTDGHCDLKAESADWDDSM